MIINQENLLDYPVENFDNIVNIAKFRDLVEITKRGDLKTIMDEVQNDTDNLNEVFAVACEFGKLRIAKYLNGHGYGNRYIVPMGWISTMDKAACNGHLPIVEYLHSLGANCSWRGLEYASEYGHFAVVKFLVSTNINRYIGLSHYAVEATCQHGKLHILKYFHSIGAILPQEINRLKRLAYKNGHFEIVDFLIAV